VITIAHELDKLQKNLQKAYLIVWWRKKIEKPKGQINEQYLRTKYKPGKHRNKQQLTKTYKTQTFTNTYEQSELPMNQEWTQVLRNRKLFMPIAIHPPINGLVHGQVPYESNPVMGGNNLQQPQIICHLGNGHLVTIYMSFNDSSNIRFKNILLETSVYQLK
jgi:hypothetical protein